MAKPIVITGYPYAYPYYFKVFEYANNKDDLIFILPKHWEAKGGKVKIDFKNNPNFKINGLLSASFGGKSLFGGLFKGWLPSLCFVLLHIRLKQGSGVLFSCLEPNLLTTLYNGFWAKIFGFQHILFTWQNVPPEKRMMGLKLKLSNALVKLNLALSDGVICGNQKAAEVVRKWKIIVCPLSGVDTEKFKPFYNTQGGSDISSSWRDKLKIGGNDKIILFYGALEKRKGVTILINAFNKLQTMNHEPRIKLVIIGTGPEKENLKSQVMGYGLQANIIFLDWMFNDELPALLNVSDVFVYPSVPLGGWEEQFGYAMAEASACEVPVVATRTGSIDEVVINGKSGILVDPNNPEQLNEAIYTILSDEVLAKQMGEFGREYIVEKFSHQVVAKKLMSFL